MYTVGIIFGASPIASAHFYKEILVKSRLLYGTQPEIILYNLSFPINIESNFIDNDGLNSKLYIEAIDKALIFMKKNNIETIIFPCFSLSPLMEDRCEIHKLCFINPLKELNLLEKSIGIISINSEYILEYFNNYYSKEFVYPFQLKKEISGIIKSIINEEDINSSHFFNSIDKYFKKVGINEYIIACSELCINKYNSILKIHNLLDILITMTINKIFND